MMNTPNNHKLTSKTPSLVACIRAFTILFFSATILNGAEYTDIIEKTFPISKGGILKTVLVDADIDVSSHDKQEIYVHITQKVKGKSEEEAQEIFAKHMIEFESQSISTKREDKKSGLWRFRSGSMQVEFKIRVPREINAQLRTVDGDVSLAGVEGDVDINSVEGDLDVKDVAGELTLKTVDGDLMLREIQGSIQGKTVDGDVEIELVGQPNADSEIESIDGDIELTLTDNVGVTIDAHVSDGDIDIPFDAESIKKRGDSIHIIASANGGGPIISLLTKDGDITAR
ncbi:MAG: DUF4097 family beta strand repeat-containing protein [Opitutales bacterium]|nr:DUF4097 family beta strand repeat-containing protein [Opitutales bacterium]